MDEIAQRLAGLYAEIEEAKERTGRTDDVTLVAVSKTVPLGRLLEAYGAGQRVFGENRVQEAVQKMDEAAARLPEARWHLIGHLQSNKARMAADRFAMIESVDSLRLAHKLSDLACDPHRLSVLLEVNVAGEEQKSGFTVQELEARLPELLALPGLSVEGLMTVAPLVENPDEVRWVFRSLRELRDRLVGQYGARALTQLSMGMSNDFRVAVEEGSTMVRVGRALFGERPPAAHRQ